VRRFSDQKKIAELLLLGNFFTRAKDDKSQIKQSPWLDGLDILINHLIFKGTIPNEGMIIFSALFSFEKGLRKEEARKYEREKPLSLSLSISFFLSQGALKFPAIFEPTTFGLAILLCHIDPSNPYSKTTSSLWQGLPQRNILAIGIWARNA
jgi:hypothetical protein